MLLVTLQSAELAFGLHPLLDRADLSLDEGERIGLIGRNGTGKSSLLNVLAGRADLDDGIVSLRDGLRVVLVEQEPQLPAASTLRESLALRGHLTPDDDHDHDHEHAVGRRDRSGQFARLGTRRGRSTGSRARPGHPRGARRAGPATARPHRARRSRPGERRDPPGHR